LPVHRTGSTIAVEGPMQLILRYGNGKRTEALLLSRSAGAMRVVIPGCKDTVELRSEGEQWADEEGLRVSIEAMVCTPAAAAMERPRTMTAS